MPRQRSPNRDKAKAMYIDSKGKMPVSYTHLDVYKRQKPDNIRKFKSTSEYFDFLKDNDFPYDLLYSTGKALKDVM